MKLFYKYCHVQGCFTSLSHLHSTLFRLDGTTDECGEDMVSRLIGLSVLTDTTEQIYQPESFAIFYKIE